MAADTLCALTELPATMCAHCTGKVGPEEEMARHRRRLLATGRWFTARYPGQCQRCGEPYEAGAAIQCARTSHGGYDIPPNERVPLVVNFVVANRARTSAAAAVWMPRVRQALRVLGSDVPAHLLPVARLRLAKPNMSLVQLGAELGLSKNAARSRLRSLCDMAERRDAGTR